MSIRGVRSGPNRYDNRTDEKIHDFHSDRFGMPPMPTTILPHVRGHLARRSENLFHEKRARVAFSFHIL